MRNWCKSSISVVCMLFLALGVQQAGAQALDLDWQDKLSKPTYPEVKFRMHQVEMRTGSSSVPLFGHPMSKGRSSL